jgi:hypothetical protein
MSRFRPSLETETRVIEIWPTSVGPAFSQKETKENSDPALSPSLLMKTPRSRRWPLVSRVLALEAPTPEPPQELGFTLPGQLMLPQPQHPSTTTTRSRRNTKSDRTFPENREL